MNYMLILVELWELRLFKQIGKQQSADPLAIICTCFKENNIFKTQQ